MFRSWSYNNNYFPLGDVIFIKSEGYKFPVYYDVDMSAAKAYSVSAIPATYFIDKDGYIVSSAKGAINELTLEDGIKKISDNK